MRRVLCWFGRHRLYRYARVGYGTFQVRCRCCRQKWGMNDGVRAFLPWSEVSELYDGPDAAFPPETWTYLTAQPQEPV